MMIKRKWGLLLFACAACLCSCSSPEAKTYGIVRFNVGDDPHSLDPRVARDPQSQTLVRMLFEGLTRVGPSDSPQLAVASSVEVSEDLTTYVFNLRACKWSNGDLVKASDFVYAWRSQLDPKTLSSNAYQLYILKNAKAIKEGKLPLEALGVEAVQDDILLVKLEYPVPYFLELIAAPFFYPIHEATDRADPQWANRVDTYVSNGPFFLKKWRHHHAISVRKNLTYWDCAEVKLEGLDLSMIENSAALRFFERGDIHWMGSPLETIPVDALTHLKHRGGLNAKPLAETAFLRINTEVSALRDPRIRKALALAIDRQAISEHILRGGQLPALSLIPPSMCVADYPYFDDHNLEKARALFDKAQERGSVLSQLEGLTVTYILSERAHLVAQAIQQQWHKAFGFRVRLEALERKVYFDQISRGEYEMAFCSWRADFHDPVNFLEVFKYQRQSTNNTGWENRHYTELLDASNETCNAHKRIDLLKRCEAILMEEMPIIPLYFYSMLYMKDPHLENVVLTSLGSLDFKWAQLAE